MKINLHLVALKLYVINTVPASLSFTTAPSGITEGCSQHGEWINGFRCKCSSAMEYNLPFLLGSFTVQKQ